MKPVAFDPRAWNIVAGLCLASGCGSRTIAGDGGATEASESAESASESAESNTTLDTEGPQPECVTDTDCTGSFYYCNSAGMCEYYTGKDGHYEHDDESDWYPECYDDSYCNTLELCVSDYCQQLFSPPSCPAPDPDPILSIPVAAVAIHFVDVDADGAEELVVATASELQVYESGSDVPLVSPRGLDSDSVDAMGGGPLDATPGDDVVILYADELRLHVSDGMGNFAAPSVMPSTWPDSIGLLDGEFDGVAPADLLTWGSSGAGVQLGSGGAFPLSMALIGTATARSLADPLGGFVLAHGTLLDFYDVSGTAIDTAEMRGDSQYTLTSIAHLGDSFDLSSSVVSRGLWTIIEQWGPGTGNLGTHWGVTGRVHAMAGADFDGNTQADVALLVDGTLQIQLRALTDQTCLATYLFDGYAQNLAVGDHDGDGDDELAVRFEAGNVEVLDGE
jgi:hypothetical protein